MVLFITIRVITDTMTAATVIIDRETVTNTGVHHSSILVKIRLSSHDTDAASTSLDL